jgi:hypothetical protein
VSRRHPLLTLLWWQAVGIALLFAHVGLVVLTGSVLLPFAATVGLVTLLYAADALAGFAVFLVFLLDQNLVISIVSPVLSPDQFHGTQGTTFALTLALTATAAYRLWSQKVRRDAFPPLLAVGGVIAAYTMLGVGHSSLGSAAAYFRSSTVALVGILLGWDLGRTTSYRVVALCYLSVITVGLSATLLELTAPLVYYEWINAARYYFLSISQAMAVVSEDFRRPQDVVAYLTNNLFNVVEGAHMVRFGGPNMHSVSYGYVLATGSIVAISLGAYWFAALLLPLLYLAGVKGAAILLLGTVALSGIGRVCGTRTLALSGACLITAYVGFAIIYGLEAGDYHVLGLMGGVNSFLQNPLGHGIGAGGNLSAEVTSSDLATAWEERQRYGSDVALESGIGVMLYQMGIGGLAIAYIILKAFAPGIQLLRSRANVIPIGIVVVTVNALFQEEAFSPYALGLLAMFAAVLDMDISFRQEAIHGSFRSRDWRLSRPKSFAG